MKSRHKSSIRRVPKALSALILSVLFCGVLAMGKANAEEEIVMTINAPVYQLRIYEIFEQNKAAFHERFRDHAARIMRKYNFNIVHMWESDYGGKTEFVYLVSWPDEDTMRRQWAAFMADREWSAIKSRTAALHGEMVGGIQERVMHTTTYSPSLVHNP